MGDIIVECESAGITVVINAEQRKGTRGNTSCGVSVESQSKAGRSWK